MTEKNDLAKQAILDPVDLTENHLQQVMSELMSNAVDMGELYFQLSSHEAWVLEDGIVKEGVNSHEQGVGVRAISGEKTGFAYSEEIKFDALIHSSRSAKAIARQGVQGVVKSWARTTARPLYKAENPLSSISDQDKVALLQSVNAHAYGVDSRVKQVIISLAGEQEFILVAASDGTLTGDVRPLVRMNVTVITEDHGRFEQASYGGGGRGDYCYFLENNLAQSYAEEAVRQALVNLQAIDAPAGPMPVVLGPGWPGILLHEAVGHGLEGDFNRKGTSAFSGRIGEQVASSLCTVVDDGTIPGRRGSLSMDDEGTSTTRTVLIENGILKAYMQDKLNAQLMGQLPTGNGRRESYAHLPMPRMTNTYLQPGAHDPEEIIRSVDNGLYAVNFGGGQVDITSGKFVFSASEAYLIEKGKITQPVKGATLIGNGPDVMTKVSMLGNDLQLDSGVGVCGKEGQSVPVGVGQPTLKIDELTVGGTGS